MSSLTSALNEVFGKTGHFITYSLIDNKVFIGSPYLPVFGVGYMYSQHKNSQTIPFNSLGGGGVFVSNKNQSGFIEVGIINGSPSNAYIQSLELLGIPYPVQLMDLKSASTSFTGGLSCRRVGTPQWRRDKIPSLTVHSFFSHNLVLSDGLRIFE